MSDSLEPIRSHPVFKVACELSNYVGIQRDLVQLSMFLTIASGGHAAPIKLEIISDTLESDLSLLNRLFALIPDRVARIDTFKQFQKLEENGFPHLDAIHVRNECPKLFRQVCVCMAHDVGSREHLPALIRIADQSDTRDSAPGVLRVMASQTMRNLASFGQFFAPIPDSLTAEFLKDHISELPQIRSYSCDFWESVRGSLSAEIESIAKRLLLLFTAIRLKARSGEPSDHEASESDYRAVRALLINLPIMPDDRKVSPQAINLAEEIYPRVQESSYQLELPDRSDQGRKWFTREDVRIWCDLSYNTAKKRLDELQNDGLLLTTRAESNRGRGKQIHFRFAAGVRPPFKWTNPFSKLPDITGDTDDSTKLTPNQGFTGSSQAIAP